MKKIFILLILVILLISCTNEPKITKVSQPQKQESEISVTPKIKTIEKQESETNICREKAEKILPYTFQFQKTRSDTWELFNSKWRNNENIVEIGGPFTITQGDPPEQDYQTFYSEKTDIYVYGLKYEKDFTFTVINMTFKPIVSLSELDNKTVEEFRLKEYKFFECKLKALGEN